jgi:hypothetical protein
MSSAKAIDKVIKNQTPKKTKKGRALSLSNTGNKIEYTTSAKAIDEFKINQTPKKKKRGSVLSLSVTKNKIESKPKLKKYNNKPSSDVLKVMKQFKSLDICPAFDMHNPFPELEAEKVSLSETLSSDKATKELFIGINSLSDYTEPEFSSVKSSRSNHKILVSNHALQRASSRGIPKEILFKGVETEGVKIVFGGQGDKSIVKTVWKTFLDEKDNWDALPEASVSASKIICRTCSITFEFNETFYKINNWEPPKRCAMCKDLKIT